MIIYGEDDIDDDDIVSNKFRKTKGRPKKNTFAESQLFKDVEWSLL